MGRFVFHSFDYQQDCQRVSQIKHVGLVDGGRKLNPNEWQKLKSLGDRAVMNWIDGELSGKSCTIVLIGTRTHQRPWVLYEAARSWALGKGVFGIHIHGLKNLAGSTSAKGANPFPSVVGLPSYSIPLHDPPYWDSRAVYAHIAQNIERWVEGAIAFRALYP